jgi:hypothetical protein
MSIYKGQFPINFTGGARRGGQTVSQIYRGGDIIYGENIVPFTPASVTSANLTMWVESDSGITTSGGYVTAWLDKSSAGNDIAGANGGVEFTSSLASINNEPCLGFKYNDNRYMTYTNAFIPNFTAGGHFFIVGSQAYDARMNSSYYPAFVSEGNTAREILGLVGKKFPETYVAPATDNYAAGGVFNNGTNTYTSDAPYTWEWQFSNFSTLEDAGQINVSTLIKMNGVSIGSLSAWGSAATGKSVTNKWLGNFKDTATGAGGSMLEGFIAAIVTYDAPLSTNDAANVRTYLQTKYGHY